MIELEHRFRDFFIYLFSVSAPKPQLSMVWQVAKYLPYLCKTSALIIPRTVVRMLSDPDVKYYLPHAPQHRRRHLY